MTDACMQIRNFFCFVSCLKVNDELHQRLQVSYARAARVNLD